MIRPVIGITGSYDKKTAKYYVYENYVQAVEAAEGLSILLLPSDSNLIDFYLDHIDGLLLTGGADLDPFLYSQEPHKLLRELSPKRDAFEIRLTRKAILKGIPILAICRGIQLLAVVEGGTLIQDISSEETYLKHEQEMPGSYPVHSVSIEQDSILYRIWGLNEIRVNSLHHQCIKEVPKGFKITAKAADGVIEAIEAVDKREILGVQWHPERMWQEDKRCLNLFNWLICAAAKNLRNHHLNWASQRKPLS